MRAAHEADLSPQDRAALFDVVERLVLAIGTDRFGGAYQQLLDLVAARPAVGAAVGAHVQALVKLLH